MRFELTDEEVLEHAIYIESLEEGWVLRVRVRQGNVWLSSDDQDGGPLHWNDELIKAHIFPSRKEILEQLGDGISTEVKIIVGQ